MVFDIVLISLVMESPHLPMHDGKKATIAELGIGGSPYFVIYVR